MPTLVTVAPGHQLATDAAASYARALAAGAPDGITSSHRSSVEQAHLRALYLAGRGAFALPPGESEHETGYALDLPEPARSWPRWAEHGWIRTNPDERWHREYRASADRHLTAHATPPQPIEEDDMFSDQDRKDVQEALRLLRVMVLAPSGRASPATAPETVYVQTVSGIAENAAETRRQGGVLLGALAPAGAERTIPQQLGKV